MSNPVDPFSAGLLALIQLCLWPASPDAFRARAEPPHAQSTASLTGEKKLEIVDKTLRALHEGYVFPEIAAQMETAIQAHIEAGDYDRIDDGAAFASMLTKHLQAVSHDKHLRVSFDAEPVSGHPHAAGTEADRARMSAEMESLALRANFGFERVERLPGNIGYLDLHGFMSAERAGETAAAAMSFLANTDALILDLRQNNGGEPGMVALLCSYFFGPEPVHLNDLYYRPTDTTEEFWTLRTLPGKRYLGKDVYVLTSPHTFSGAEECAYNLKTLKRATIVGETTGGGANPGGSERLDAHFSVFVPTGRAINPITKTNWEGVGVEPDVQTSADDALKTAHGLALDKAIEQAQSDPALRSDLLEARGRIAAGASAQR